MNRPAKHSESDFLAAAAALFAEGGIQAVTMARIARAVGAPSGSLYHRFADRPALLYALWRTSEEQFAAAFRELTDRIENVESALRAVAGVVEWCRSNVERAVVLQAGSRELLSDTWSDTAHREQRRDGRRRTTELTALTTTLSARIGVPADEVGFALLEVPLAVVRPHLLARRPPPPAARDLAVRIAGRILS